MCQVLYNAVGAGRIQCNQGGAEGSSASEPIAEYPQPVIADGSEPALRAVMNSGGSPHVKETWRGEELGLTSTDHPGSAIDDAALGAALAVGSGHHARLMDVAPGQKQLVDLRIHASTKMPNRFLRRYRFLGATDGRKSSSL